MIHPTTELDAVNAMLATIGAPAKCAARHRAVSGRNSRKKRGEEKQSW
jgi:hypothetical protein